MFFRLQFLCQVPETPEKDPDADGANGVLLKSKTQSATIVDLKRLL